ncbi:MAG: tryptophan synthase subunit alpha, partial [Niameybacter sp.]
ELEEFEHVAKDYEVHMIRLIAPTSGERTRKIVEKATGFLYCVSSLGVTGVRENITTDFTKMFEEIKKVATIPTALGFGISIPEQAYDLKQYADGIIVGSAIVRMIEERGEEATEEIRDFAMRMKIALS